MIKSVLLVPVGTVWICMIKSVLLVPVGTVCMISLLLVPVGTVCMIKKCFTCSCRYCLYD